MAKKSTYLNKAKQKRVLYIITKSVWGGAAKYVYDLATNLPKDKFTAIVAGGGQGEFAQKIKKSNIPYFEIKNFQRKINIFKDFLAIFEILRLFFKTKPDIIHVNSSKAGGITGVANIAFNILHQTQTIFTAHGWAFKEDRPKWQINLIKLASKLTCLFYDKIICVSKYDKKIALENNIAPANKLIAIHNGFDLEDIVFLSKEEAQKKLMGGKISSPSGRFIIGSIAEWTRNKGLPYLLEAMAKINSPKIDLVLVGSGENPDKEKILNLIKKYQLKNVYLHEWIPDAASYLKAFDVFVLPSIKEGLPYTILEAMDSETAIIATDVGGIPEMIENNISGILIQPRNSQVLAEKIIELMNNPNLALKITQKAKEKVVREFNLENMIRGTKGVYS